MDALLGKTLGRYQIRSRVGEGGMALVYRAYDPIMRRDVALKLIHPRFAADRKYAERFERELRAVAQLQHPHILEVYDSGEGGGRIYMVMPFVTGGTVADWMATSHSVGELLDLFRPVALALDYAHLQRLIHRDVKPGNILLLSNGTPKLADFGIARRLGEPELTEPGYRLGSVSYMAPEQAYGDVIDGRADLYSLAVVLYQALTGQLPFEHRNGRRWEEPYRRPSRWNPALPSAVDGVLLRALARRPDERYKTGAELMHELAGALAGIVAVTIPTATLENETPRWRGTPPSPPQGGGQAVRRNTFGRRAFGAVVASGALVLLGAYLGGAGQRSEQQPTATTGGSAPPPVRPTATVTTGPVLPIRPTAVPTASTGNAIHRDDFSAPGSGFQPEANSTARSVLAYGDGFYRIVVPASGTIEETHTAATIWRGHTVDNFVAEVTARWAQAGTSGAYGLLLRDGPEGGYGVAINHAGFVRIHRRLAKVDLLLQDWTPCAACQPGQLANTLRVRCVGDSISVTINDTPVASVRDKAIAFGGVGMFVHAWETAAEARFTEFKLLRPS